MPVNWEQVNESSFTKFFFSQITESKYAQVYLYKWNVTYLELGENDPKQHKSESVETVFLSTYIYRWSFNKDLGVTMSRKADGTILFGKFGKQSDWDRSLGAFAAQFAGDNS